MPLFMYSTLVIMNQPNEFPMVCKVDEAQKCKERLGSLTQI